LDLHGCLIIVAQKPPIVTYFTAKGSPKKIYLQPAPKCFVSPSTRMSVTR